MKIIKYALLSLILVLFVTNTAYAANEIGLDPSKLKSGVTISADPGADLARVFKNSINILFAIGAMGFMIMVIWGAVDWILSGGDKEKVSSARKKMTHAIIGLVLLSLSFVIINLVGQIVGFNPLGNLQLRDLGTTSDPLPNSDQAN